MKRGCVFADIVRKTHKARVTHSSDGSSPELGTGHAALPSALLVKLVGHMRHSDPPSSGPYVPEAIEDTSRTALYSLSLKTNCTASGLCFTVSEAVMTRPREKTLCNYASFPATCCDVTAGVAR